MLPNPFEKPLTDFKDTDPLKNQEIVRSLLGEGGVYKYRKILSGTAVKQTESNDRSLDDLRAEAAEAAQLKDRLSFEGFEANFKKIIERCYESQIQSLQAIGFIEKNRDEALGFTDIENNFHEIPSLDAVQKHFISIPGIKEKVEQGFRRLLIVPFGAPLDSLREKTIKLVLKHANEEKLLDKNNKKLELDYERVFVTASYFEGVDVGEDLVYYPETFNVIDNKGLTKRQLLSNKNIHAPFSGYHVLLLQEDMTIPREGKGNKKKDRPQLEAGESANDYLEMLKTNPTYSKEVGFTPEDWLTLFSTNLDQTNQVINNYLFKKDSIGALLGSYLLHSQSVPSAGWNCIYKHGILFEFQPDAPLATIGALSAVA